MTSKLLLTEDWFRSISVKGKALCFMVDLERKSELEAVKRDGMTTGSSSVGDPSTDQHCCHF